MEGLRIKIRLQARRLRYGEIRGALTCGNQTLAAALCEMKDTEQVFSGVDEHHGGEAWYQLVEVPR